MQRIVSRGCLWFAVIWWAIWFGGQFFNALMVVPYFSSDLPQSLAAWGEMRTTYVGDFFVIFNPIWIAVALAMSLASGWASYGRARTWAMGSLVAAVISALSLVLWMVPTIAGLVSAQDATISLSEIQRTLHQWTIANWGRLVIEFDGLVCALLALVVGARSE